MRRGFYSARRSALRGTYGSTALHEAARAGSPESIRVLLEQGADIKVADSDGSTALHEAARAGSPGSIIVLLEKGADVQVADNYGKTALYEAARAGSPESVKVLLDKGADVLVADIYGSTALHEAARVGPLGSIRLLLDKGANIQVANSYGQTALHEAVRAGSLESVQELLENGANIHVVDNYGRTALHEAARAGSVEFIQELLRGGANAQAADKYGETALHKAARAGSVESIRELLRNGANTQAADKHGQTALHKAARSGSVEVIRTLSFHRNTDIQVADKDGRTALHEAALAGSLENIRELIRCGVKINKVVKGGQTPLHKAALAGSPDAIRELLRADINAPPISRLPVVANYLNSSEDHSLRLKQLEHYIVTKPSFSKVFQPDKEQNGLWRASRLSDQLSEEAEPVALVSMLQTVLSMNNDIISGLAHLTACQFADSTYNVIVKDPKRCNVCQVIPISLETLTALRDMIQESIDTIRVYAENTNLKVNWTKIENLLNQLFRASEATMIYLGFSTSDRPTVHEILWLGLVSYIHSHTATFHMVEFNQCCERLMVSLYTGSIIFHKRELACLEEFISGPIWLFESSEANTSDRLSLSTLIADFADLWGPARLIYSEEDEIVEISVRGGSIRQIPERDGKLLGDEVFCHWYSWNELTYNADAKFAPFRPGAKLLIGSDFEFRVNERCRESKEYSTQLDRFPLHTKEEEWKKEARSSSYSLSKIVGFGVSISQKLHPAYSLKDAIIEEWVTELGRNQLHQPEPAYLDQFLGLEISSCTGNARRVRLWELLKGLEVVNYVRNTFSKDDGVEYGELCNSNDLFCSVWCESPNKHDFLKKVICRLIRNLGDTGCGNDGRIKAWNVSSPTSGVEIKAAWASMLKDSSLCATFAMLAPHCLEYKTYKCRSERHRGLREIVLLTRLAISQRSSNRAVREAMISEPRPQEPKIPYDLRPAEARKKKVSEIEDTLRTLVNETQRSRGGSEPSRPAPHRNTFYDSLKSVEHQQTPALLQLGSPVNVLQAEIFKLRERHGKLRLTKSWSNRQIEISNTYERTPVSVTWEPDGVVQKAAKFVNKALTAIETRIGSDTSIETFEYTEHLGFELDPKKRWICICVLDEHDLTETLPPPSLALPSLSEPGGARFGESERNLYSRGPEIGGQMESNNVTN